MWQLSVDARDWDVRSSTNQLVTCEQPAPASLYVIKLQLRGLNYIDLNERVCVCGWGAACLLSISYRYSLYRRSTDLIITWLSLFMLQCCDLFIRQSLRRVIIWAISSCASLICQRATNWVDPVMSQNLPQQTTAASFIPGKRKTTICRASSSSNVAQWPTLLVFRWCFPESEADKVGEVSWESE